MIEFFNDLMNSSFGTLMNVVCCFGAMIAFLARKCQQRRMGCVTSADLSGKQGNVRLFSLSRWIALVVLCVVAGAARADHSLETALHAAVLDGDVAEVTRLVEAGADVDWQNERGWSPLYIAVRRKHREIAEVLLRAGANANYESGEGLTPLGVILEDAGSIWLTVEKDQDAAFLARLRQDQAAEIEMLELLLHFGADPTQVTYRGRRTPALMAVGSTAPHLLSILLEKGKVTPEDDPHGALLSCATERYDNLRQRLSAAPIEPCGIFGIELCRLPESECDAVVEVIRLLLEKGFTIDLAEGEDPARTVLRDAMCRLKRCDEALAFGRRLAALSEGKGPDSWEGNLHYDLSRLSYLTGDLEESREYALKAREFFERCFETENPRFSGRDLLLFYVNMLAHEFDDARAYALSRANDQNCPFDPANSPQGWLDFSALSLIPAWRESPEELPAHDLIPLAAAAEALAEFKYTANAVFPTLSILLESGDTAHAAKMAARIGRTLVKREQLDAGFEFLCMGVLLADSPVLGDVRYDCLQQGLALSNQLDSEITGETMLPSALLELGRALMLAHRSSYDRARELARSVCVKARDNGDTTSEHEALAVIERITDIEAQRLVLDMSSFCAKQTVRRQGPEVRASYHILAAGAARQLGEYDKARSHLANGWALIEPLSPSLESGNLSMVAAAAFARLSMPDAAQTCVQHSIESLLSAGYSNLVAGHLRSLAAACLESSELHEAAKSYISRARELDEKHGDRVGLALDLQLLAQFYLGDGQETRADLLQRRAREIRAKQETGPLDPMELLDISAEWASTDADHELARDYWNSRIDDCKRRGDLQGQAEALSAMAMFPQLLRVDEQFKALQRALEIYVALKHANGALQTHLHLGTTHLLKGDLTAARASYSEAEALAKLSVRADLLAQTQLFETVLALWQGNLGKAQLLCTQTAEFCEAHGCIAEADCAKKISSLIDIMSGGDGAFREQDELLRDMAIRLAWGIPLGELQAQFLRNLPMPQYLDFALGLYALQLGEPLPRAARASIHSDVADVLACSELHPMALAHYARSQELLGEDDMLLRTANCLQMATIHLQADEVALAKALLLSEGLPDAHELNIPSMEAAAHLLLAGAYYAEDELGDAEEHLIQATELLDKIRSSLPTETQRMRFHKEMLSDAYPSLVYTQIRLGKTEEAFRSLERGRGKTLIDLLFSQSALNPREDNSSLAAIASVDNELAQARLRRTQTNSAIEREAISEEIAALEHELETEIQALYRTNSELGALAANEPLSLDVLQKMLGTETCLVEYWLPGPMQIDSNVQEDNLWVFVVTGDSVDLVTVPVTRSELSRVLQTYYRLATKWDPEPDPENRKLATKASAALYAWLLESVEDRWTQAKRLIIVPHGPLFRCPFGSLRPSENRDSQLPAPLGERIDVIMALSARSLTFAKSYGRSEGYRHAGKLFIANPERPDRTVHSDMAFWRGFTNGSAVFTGANASLESLQHGLGAEPSPYVVHLRCHGEFKDDDPAASRLLLARDGAHPDGDLRMHEIYTLNLSGVSLVTLQACEMGMTEQTTGDDVLGMVRGFMVAGASSVICPLWEIEEGYSDRFLRAFYEKWENGKRSKSEALRETIREFRLKNDSVELPFHYWSAFVLYGNWE